MLFFDFLHYHIFKYYSGFKEKGALSTAAGIVGGFQVINIMAIMMLYMLTQKEDIKFEKWVVVVLFIIFQIYTYIRYIYREDHSIEAIERIWLNKTASYRKQLRALLFIYGAISIIGAFGLAIYLGSRN
jgi:Ca2+/Na+ antiporter